MLKDNPQSGETWQFRYGDDEALGISTRICCTPKMNGGRIICTGDTIFTLDGFLENFEFVSGADDE
jgi:hypothetical protein